jgi:hypothetical protein
MPITLTGRSINTGNLSPMIPIVANNPAFKVQIVPVDGRMEEKPRQQQDTAEQDAIKVGDYITGEESSGGRKRGRKVAGRVLQILNSGQEVYAYKILDGDGEEVNVDPTTAEKDEASAQLGESKEYVMSYKSWLVECRKL